METTSRDSGLGEALASYQPTSMSDALWGRFRDNAIDLVLRLDHRSDVAARRSLSLLVMFLADVAPSRPNAELADLLTKSQVEGYLERCLASGGAPGTVENRQGALNALLRAAEGRPPARQRRSTESHLEPHAWSELEDVVIAAMHDGSEQAVCLARTILCAMTGHPLPRQSAPDPVAVEVTGRTVTVNGHRWRAPAELALPSSGHLDHTGVERGRRWGRRSGVGFRLDRRRIVLTYITHVVATQPAAVALQLPGVGRDRLTAATAAAERPCPAVQKALLRGAEE